MNAFELHNLVYSQCLDDWLTYQCLDVDMEAWINHVRGFETPLHVVSMAAVSLTLVMLLGITYTACTRTRLQALQIWRIYRRYRYYFKADRLPHKPDNHATTALVPSPLCVPTSPPLSRSAPPLSWKRTRKSTPTPTLSWIMSPDAFQHTWLRYLDVCDLARLAAVSRHWQLTVERPAVWKSTLSWHNEHLRHHFALGRENELGVQLAKEPPPSPPPPSSSSSPLSTSSCVSYKQLAFVADASRRVTDRLSAQVLVEPKLLACMLLLEQLAEHCVFVLFLSVAKMAVWAGILTRWCFMLLFSWASPFFVTAFVPIFAHARPDAFRQMYLLARQLSLLSYKTLDQENVQSLFVTVNTDIGAMLLAVVLIELASRLLLTSAHRRFCGFMSLSPLFGFTCYVSAILLLFEPLLPSEAARQAVVIVHCGIATCFWIFVCGRALFPIVSLIHLPMDELRLIIYLLSTLASVIIYCAIIVSQAMPARPPPPRPLPLPHSLSFAMASWSTSNVFVLFFFLSTVCTAHTAMYRFLCDMFCCVGAERGTYPRRPLHPFHAKQLLCVEGRAILQLACKWRLVHPESVGETQEAMDRQVNSIADQIRSSDSNIASLCLWIIFCWCTQWFFMTLSVPTRWQLLVVDGAYDNLKTVLMWLHAVPVCLSLVRVVYDHMVGIGLFYSELVGTDGETLYSTTRKRLLRHAYWTAMMVYLFWEYSQPRTLLWLQSWLF